MNYVKKFFIYVFTISGCAFLGLGTGWLIVVFGSAVAFVVGGKLLVDMIGYPSLLIPPAISLVALCWGYLLADKISNSTLTKKDKLKFTAFLVSSLAGFCILLFKIVKDSYPSLLDKVSRFI